MLGIALSSIMLLMIGGVVMLGKFQQQRIWIGLACLSFIILIVDRYSIIESVELLGQDVDQLSAWLLLLGSLGTIVWHRLRKRQTSNPIQP